MWKTLMMALLLCSSGCEPSMTDLIRAYPCVDVSVDTTSVPHDSVTTWPGHCTTVPVDTIR